MSGERVDAMRASLSGSAAEQNAQAPRAGALDRLARTVIEGMALSRLDAGTLTLELPSGAQSEHHGRRPGPAGMLRIESWRALWRFIMRGDVGFGEGYMQGDWSTPDLSGLLEWGLSNEKSMASACAGPLPSLLINRLRHLLRANTRRGSRRNVEAHYDLGNDFYAGWLDAGMNYSSGLYLRPDMTLAEAQDAKLDRAIALLGVEPGHRVLEIGCGWGSLAERLATLGCEVTGITLSNAQLAYARTRLESIGCADRASILLRDYRDVTGRFNAIVSIEMLEAAGEKYWPVYFAKLKSCLAPGGTAVLQVITIDESRYEDYRRRPDFIQRYIFPGGVLPTVSILRAQTHAAGLKLRSVDLFGESYARTLAAWRERFLRSRASIGGSRAQIERFRRMWEYYLAYCEAGFRLKALNVGLYRITH